MSEVLSALRQLEVLCPEIGSVDPLRTWWLEPIRENCSMENICKSSVASARLAQGLEEASFAYRMFPDLISSYLAFAHACVSDLSPRDSFPKPLWLDWVESTSDAIREWHEKIATMNTQLMVQDFLEKAWTDGIAQIRAGRSRVALRIWRDSAARILEAADARSIALRMAAEEFQLALNLSATINVRAPEEPADPADVEGWRSSLDRWWAEVADPALNRLFWDAHLPFLDRARYQPTHQLAVDEKRALTQLIKSGVGGQSPSFKETLKLSQVHANAFAQILALREIGSTQRSLHFD